MVIYILNPFCEVDYDISWDLDYCFIHRLCTAVKWQHKGIAHETLGHIEKQVKKMGIATIRLDVFADNPYAMRLYEHLGYKKISQAEVRIGRLYLLEKKI